MKNLRIIFLFCFILVLGTGLIVACGNGEKQDLPTPTVTPEWADYYPGIPGRNYFAPGKEINKNPDPTGTFYIDELIVGFRPGLSEDRIAEILAEKNLEVKAYYGKTDTFLLEVDPKQRDGILLELKSHSEIELASKSDIFEGTNEY